MNKQATVKNQAQGETILLGDAGLSIEDVDKVANGGWLLLDLSSDALGRASRSADWLLESLVQDGVIYGVTTGYGDSCVVDVPQSQVQELPRQLARFHGCGMGQALNVEETRAVITVRLASLCRGYSGVRLELLDRLVSLLNENILPLIPSEGSVGASGDLTPLSYIAAVLMGEREVMCDGDIRPADDVFKELGLAPLTLYPKEGLALMNGTAVMTGLACIAYRRAEYLTRLASRLTSLAVVALGGNPNHFNERLFQVKPHPGQAQVAHWIRKDLHLFQETHRSTRLQDRYSLRCAPHVIGVLQDFLPTLRQFIETEINSSNDNPIIDEEERQILHGGHFYGGHIAFAMDSLKNCVANIADLMDRQMALLVDPKFNNGLPANLSGATGANAPINHGFKAVQIAMSAWCAEALKLTMPASVFSRSTECHNQDKVSMGTISARDCLRILTLTEQVAAGLAMAVVQAVELRIRDHGDLQLGENLCDFMKDVRAITITHKEDRRFDKELTLCQQAIQHGAWKISYDC